MHLDDALGNHERLHCIFNHHEQACTMAAESYARVENRMAAACVTSGEGYQASRAPSFRAWLSILLSPGNSGFWFRR